MFTCCGKRIVDVAFSTREAPPAVVKVIMRNLWKSLTPNEGGSRYSDLWPPQATHTQFLKKKEKNAADLHLETEKKERRGARCRRPFLALVDRARSERQTEEREEKEKRRRS